ncbi:uncharacterized protein LOC116250938 [Nymphaea colorata]|nr:uncharacterized protein LOC116250938 [Nymphaea colorata]
MSLVDYASSSDEESDKEEGEEERGGGGEDKGRAGPRPNPSTLSSHSNRNPVASSRQDQAPNSSQRTIQRLPDVSQLLDSPSFTPDQLNGGDHSSRVAAAMAARELKKRESNGSLPSLPQRKIARGNLPPQRIQPDTVGSRLLPPQISGRSNVVTEDIDKLFVKRRREENGGHSDQ